MKEITLGDFLIPFYGTSDDMKIFNNENGKFLSDEEVDIEIRSENGGEYKDFVVYDYDSQMIECSSGCTEIVVTIHKGVDS